MRGLRILLSALAANVCGGLLIATAHAQIGEQPIRIIFPFAAGGSGDALARLIAGQMRASLNRPVIVENRTGAAGRIGVQAVKSGGARRQHASAYPDRADGDLPARLQVARLRSDPRFRAARRRSRHSIWRRGRSAGSRQVAQGTGRLGEGRPGADKLRHARRRQSAALPRHHVRARRRYGPARDHLSRFGRGARRSGGRAYPDAVHNHVRHGRDASRGPHPRAGDLRSASVAVPARCADLPRERTTIGGTGWYGMFAPAKTPADVVARLNKAIVAAVKTPDVRERMLARVSQPTGTSAAELGQIQRRDSEFWAPAIKASGFKPAQQDQRRGFPASSRRRPPGIAWRISRRIERRPGDSAGPALSSRSLRSVTASARRQRGGTLSEARPLWCRPARGCRGRHVVVGEPDAARGHAAGQWCRGRWCRGCDNGRDRQIHGARTDRVALAAGNEARQIGLTCIISSGGVQSGHSCLRVTSACRPRRSLRGPRRCRSASPCRPASPGRGRCSACR